MPGFECGNFTKYGTVKISRLSLVVGGELDRAETRSIIPLP